MTGDLAASVEWNLAADLPALGSNAGLEGITWMPADVLVAQGLVDESTGAAYDPATYPSADGVFFVGVEGTGGVYGYALADDGTFTRVASFDSGFPGVMEIQYEPASGALWVGCDEVCDGETAVFSVGTDGDFASSVVYERPAGMANLANEGFAIAAPDTCTDGLREAVWADDSATDTHSLRVGAIDCEASDDGGGDGDGSGDADDNGDSEGSGDASGDAGDSSEDSASGSLPDTGAPISLGLLLAALAAVVGGAALAYAGLRSRHNL